MMSQDTQNSFKDIYPPTPAVFSRRVDSAVRALPERGARWKLPKPAIAGYAATACVTMALIMLGVMLPAAPGATAQPEASTTPNAAMATDGAPSTLATLPPADPLPQLAVTENAKTPASEDGWQAAAVSGDTIWYYRDTDHKVVIMKEEDTTSITLDIGAGQTIDTDTFTPGNTGRWLAFTVHEPGGDKVWVVTGDGRKMVVPDDVRWVDEKDNPLPFDFSDASIIGFSDNQSFYNTSTDVSDGMQIKVMFPEGDLYFIMISLNSADGNAAVRMDDRRGIYYCAYKKDNSRTIINKNRYIYFITNGKDGNKVLSIGGRQYEVPLQNDRFEFFDFPISQSPLLAMNHALFIYENDPTRTLWELNIGTGETAAVATGCTSAEWIDEKTYWYTTQADSAVIIKREASGINTVNCQVTLSYGPSSSSYVDGVETITSNVYIMAVIQNNSDSDVVIPDEIPCSLSIRCNDTAFWSKKGTISLSDMDHFFYSSANGTYGEGKSGPVTLHPGETMELNSEQITCNMTGDLIMEGSFYNTAEIYMKHTFNNEILIPSGASITGEIDDLERVRITVDNQSRATMMVYQILSGSNYLPPTVYYRLSSNGRIVDHGEFQISAIDPAQKHANVLSGKSIPFIESGEKQKFNNLDPGEYLLECCLRYGEYSSYEAWGRQLGYYFDIAFQKR